MEAFFEILNSELQLLLQLVFRQLANNLKKQECHHMFLISEMMTF